jgi:hypothetical protein
VGVSRRHQPNVGLVTACQLAKRLAANAQRASWGAAPCPATPPDEPIGEKRTPASHPKLLSAVGGWPCGPSPFIHSPKGQSAIRRHHACPGIAKRRSCSFATSLSGWCTSVTARAIGSGNEWRQAERWRSHTLGPPSRWSAALYGQGSGSRTWDVNGHHQAHRLDRQVSRKSGSPARPNRHADLEAARRIEGDVRALEHAAGEKEGTQPRKDAHDGHRRFYRRIDTADFSISVTASVTRTRQ